MKMAKASDAEWQKVMDFVNKLEEMSGNWRNSDKEIGEYVRLKMPPMQRVVYGYRVLVDNCCDPKSDVLAFKPELVAPRDETAGAQ